MLGRIVSSNGIIEMKPPETEKEIILGEVVYELNLIITNHCKVYINDSPHFIYLPIIYTQPFSIKGIPIWKFKICMVDRSIYPFEFSYYGFY
ncbi:hypothetical protein [Aneurinibacillus aneurinilyticus]|uniref:hypothetical protein n=1 Tax=Aneurinibacillus aneurinilyticus TaxID=1391 RepID=UPI0023F6F23C|nr:hypothetical protein [Aneurinibacillus aneurinilyticus]MCI1693305.1 hypothetical protein [Aneurinibacillus aneurinilyticus]